MRSGRIAAQQPCESMANASTPTCPAAPHTPTALLQLQMTSVCAQWMEDICLLTLQLHNPLGSEPAQKSWKTELMSAFSLDRSQSKSYIFTDAVGKMWVFGKVVAKVTGSKSLRFIRLLMHTLPKVKSAVSCLFPYTPLTQIPRLCGVEVWYSKGCLYLRARFDIFIPKIQKISHFCLLNAFGG